MSETGGFHMGEDREFGKKPPEINWKGRLDGGQENPNLWRGAISAKLDTLKARLGLDSDAKIRQVLDEKQQEINHYYVKANPNAQVRCIDGRNEGEPDDEPNLGPQTSGGSPVNALLYRFAADFENVNEATAESDLERYHALITELGLPYPAGAHEDEHNAASLDKTGCGAIDKMLEILEIMEQEELLGATKLIAGEYFSEEVFMDIRRRSKAITGPHLSNKYFIKDEYGQPRHGNRLINKVKGFGHQRGQNAVEKLKGGHNEVFLVINKVRGETFNRDKFAHDNDNKLQSFGYDVWHAIERAEALFPDNEDARSTFITANVMYAVATAIALTDGSLELGIRE